MNTAANTGEPDGKVTSDDPVFYLAVDPQGRRVATYRDQDRHPKETFVWTLAGISGPGGGGGVANGTLILRDRNENGSDPLAWATVEGSDTRPERHYSVSDHTGSVVALLGLRPGENEAPTATLAEQYRYSATGVPYGVPLGDIVADGVVTTADVDVVEDLSGSSGYQVRADLNLDGLVTPDDAAVAQPNLGLSTGRGYFGIITLRNRVGLGQLERTLRVGPGWNTGGGVYREDVNRHVGTEVVGGGGSGVNPRDIAPSGCVKVPCPAGDCGGWSCVLTIVAVVEQPQLSLKYCKTDINDAWCSEQCREYGEGGLTFCPQPGIPRKRCCVCTRKMRVSSPMRYEDIALLECVDEHEGVHMRQRCPFPQRDTPASGCLELPAYTIEYVCLQRKRDNCPTDECRRVLDERIRQMGEGMKKMRELCAQHPDFR